MSKLREALDLISPPGRWAKYTLARTKRGSDTDPTEKDAYGFCSLGALIKVGCQVLGQAETSPEHVQSKEHRYLLKAAQKMGYINVPDLNDGSSKATVKKMFCLAICMEREESEHIKGS